MSKQTNVGYRRLTARWHVLIVALLLTTACGKSVDEKSAASGSGPVPASTVSAPVPIAHGVFLHGGQRDALVSYLRNVRETPARKFTVEFNADVVAIDRDTAIDTLQSVSADGSVFRFTGQAVAIRKLTAGRILFLWGIALRRIVNAVADGDDWVVTTKPVSFPEVFRNADIDFEYPFDARQGFARASDVETTPTATRFVPADQRVSTLMPVAFISEASAAEAPPVGPTVVDLPTSYSAKVGGFDLEMAYQPIEGGLHFDIEARKQQSDVQANTGENPRADIDKYNKQKRKDDVQGIRDGESKLDWQKRGEADAKARNAAKDWGKAAAGGANAPLSALTQGLFQIGSDLLDLRLKASGDLTGISAADTLSVSNQLQIHGSALGLFKTEFRNLNGKLKLQFIARRGENSEQWIEKLKLEVPIRFNFPVIVAGLPMVFQVGFDVIVQPALTTKNDTFDAEYEIPFSGSGNVSLEGDKFTVGGTLASSPNPLKTLASSIGVSAILVAIQAPRVGLGLDLFAASTVVYIDLVSSATITSGGALGLAPCRQYQLVSSINAGVDTKITFDVPGLPDFIKKKLEAQANAASQAASLRENIFKKTWYRIEPDIPVCRITKSGTGT